MVKFNKKSLLYKALICGGLIFCIENSAVAQENNTAGSVPTDSTLAAKMAAIKKKKEEKVEKLSLKERFAFRANMVDWFLATQSIGVQFDLTPWDYNKMTIGAELKYNPGSNQTFEPKVEYEMLHARLEFRKYFRESLTIKPGQKREPKYWRAYYWGLYAGYTDYTIFFNNGYTGRHIGLGGTAGWEIPMLTFKNGALDLDLGISAGWIYGESMKRVSGENGYEFVNVKDWHFTPYPIISEVRVGLVYRFKSVKFKYNRSKR